MNVGKSPRINEQPGFILHRYPYRETSLIIEAFTRDYGRVALIAKGAKRPHSALRNTLQNFTPLLLSWSGKNEVRTLTRADWSGGLAPLSGQGLLYGFYLNELIIKFCAREDAHEKLFEQYANALHRLTQEALIAPILRHFEYALLVETGHARALNWCSVKQQLVEPTQNYIYDPNQGISPSHLVTNIAPPMPLSTAPPLKWPTVCGQTLIDICIGDYTNPSTAQQSKQLMRCLLHHYLQGTPLSTRKILIELHQ